MPSKHCRIHADTNEPRCDGHNNVLSVPQRRLLGTKRTGETSWTYYDDSAVQRLPYGLYSVETSDL